MVAALSAAARLGILIKNVADIELAAKINAFIFDKTGTLTTGRTGRQPPGAAERRHARRIAAPRGLRREIQQPPDGQGAGATGRRSRRAAGRAEGFCRNRRPRREGARSTAPRCWSAARSGCKDNGVQEDFLKSVDLNETEGWSLIFVARDGRCIGWVGLQDQTRAEARSRWRN